MDEPAGDRGGVDLHFRYGGRDRTVTISAERIDQGRGLARRILTEPFRRRSWADLGFYFLSGTLAVVAAFVTLALLTGGVALALVLIGLLLITAAVRFGRATGRWQRSLARTLLGDPVAEPEPRAATRGFFRWLWAALWDPRGWRGIAYTFVKLPLVLITFLIGVAAWVDAILWILAPSGHHNEGFGLPTLVVTSYSSAATHFFAGLVLLFVAPWAMRALVGVDQLVLRALLGPDAATRIRRLEADRARTVDTSAATLRRIERDLHDGTQAQLVALAMRLGQAKEELGSGEAADLDEVRRLVDEAHRGAKEAIVELRNLARGIHPPVLDTGLPTALATLAARSPVPIEVSVAMTTRPSPAIEAIAYFCAAELLANVAQHAEASGAWLRWQENGASYRLEVGDDGRGGARVPPGGSASSGLVGLTDRVAAVDGRLEVASPPGGPTVVTVVLPARA